VHCSPLLLLFPRKYYQHQHALFVFGAQKRSPAVAAVARQDENFVLDFVPQPQVLAASVVAQASATYSCHEVLAYYLPERALFRTLFSMRVSGRHGNVRIVLVSPQAVFLPMPEPHHLEHLQ